jgi:hypothetical protein
MFANGTVGSKTFWLGVITFLGGVVAVGQCLLNGMDQATLLAGIGAIIAGLKIIFGRDTEQKKLNSIVK